MQPIYTIDLQKNKKLYHFTETDIPQNFLDSAPNEAAKGAMEQKAVNLAKNGGFVLIPSSQMIQREAETTLKEVNNRQQILNDILSEKPLPGLLGLISFKRETIDRIKTIEISPSETFKIDEPYTEESLTIELTEPIDNTNEDIDFDLSVFGLDSTKSTSISAATANQPPKGATAKGGNDSNQTTNLESLDVITEAVYYDANGKIMHREFLIPETVNDLSNNGLIVNINNRGHDISSRRRSRSASKSSLLQKIKVFVRKLVGKVRELIKDLREFGIDIIIQKLKGLIFNPYKILKYDLGKRKFKKCKAKDIQPEKRTLILLHGTIKGSFNGLLKNKLSKRGSFMYLNNYAFRGYKHWFDYLMNEQNIPSQYEQILALEHETLLDDPEANVKAFMDKLGLKDVVFEKPVSIVAASRGSLLAKYISVSPLAANMKIDRVAIISGGYSDYFDSKRGVKQYINSLTKLFPINLPLRLLLSLSLDIILELPGLDIQRKDSPRFQQLIQKQNNVCYFNMTNNYTGSSSKEKIFEAIADFFLGKENDLALSMAAQKDHRPGYIHTSFPNYNRNERHGRALNIEASKMVLFYFLVATLDQPEDRFRLTD